MHLSVPAPPLSALRVPSLHLSGRLRVAAVLLSVVYAAAVAVALAAPGQHTVAGCAVLTGLVSRSVVRRRRSATDAVAAATVAVDTIAVDAVLPEETATPAPAATA
ncbi:MAG: uncharacterized protein JWP68_578 [Modestobacter sp.]|nr:uncharacterized protein [Modestobacter sp.]MCW2576139.1 uncharacterized protein [Modestobacter sp.]